MIREAGCVIAGKSAEGARACVTLLLQPVCVEGGRGGRYRGRVIAVRQNGGEREGGGGLFEGSGGGQMGLRDYSILRAKSVTITDWLRN